MRLSPAITSATVAGLLVGMPMLVAAGRGALRPRVHRSGPYHVLRVGLVIVGAVVAAPSIALTFSPHLLDTPQTRLDLGAGIAVAAAAASVALVGGLLFLPGLAATNQERIGRVLDGLLIAAGACFAAWVLLVSRSHDLHQAALRACAVAILPVGFALAICGVTAQAGLRAPRPRGAAGLVSLGVALAVSGGAAAAAACCYGRPVLLAPAGVLAVCGAALVAGSMARVGRPALWLARGRAWVPGAIRSRLRGTGIPDPLGVEITRELSYSGGLPTRVTGLIVPIVVVLAICLTSVYSIVDRGGLDQVSVIVSIIAGLGLLARQSLAVYDTQRAAAKLAQGEQYFRQLAHTDPLTGLANRRCLMRVREPSTGSSGCALLGLDLDGFKNINDMRGHEAGDEVLIEVGRRLRSHLRPGDIAARLGGDEFAVLMWASPAEALHVAERLLDVLSRPYYQGMSTVFLSTSIGVAACPAGAADIPTLLRNADLALRHAKQRGKGRVELYDARYEAMLRRRTMIEQELRGAIERDELHLAFQPVVSLPSVRPVGAEALLRWHHPVLGQISPAEFIPIAEEAGLIDRIGRWVLHQACHQLSRWLAEGHDVWVSVNVSVRELHNPDYSHHVAEVLRAHRVPAQRVVLEVTEQAIAVDLDELVQRLASLRSTGVRIALDDFGAGYSSLGQLHRLPVDILKIDRGLLSGSAPGALPFVEVVVRLGHQLGLAVITEGVEEAAQRKHIELVGGQLGQGSLFGQPLPAEHVEAMLAAVTPRTAPATGRTAPATGRTAPATGRTAPATARRAQDVGPVDSGHEMSQA